MSSPFDAQPDRRLGDLLRTHLEARDHAAFVARVCGVVAVAGAGSSWDVLADWVRPGLAAAAGLILAIGLWMGLGASLDTEPLTLADAVQAVGVPAPLLAGAQGASNDAMLAAVVGDQ